MKKEKLYIQRPRITIEDIEAVVEVLKSGNLVQGARVAALEEKVANYTGAEYCSATSNGTSTLHLALLTLGIRPGDEVLVPAFSYVATANVVELVGATPVFVDIDIDTFNIKVEDILAKTTIRTRAIIPVHEFGLCANMPEIVKIAKERNLLVIEDAACALGAEIDGIKAGNFGDFASFSLHPRKSITSGEGGLLVTSNDLYDKRVKILRNHGLEIKSEFSMDFSMAGYNYRLTDIQAALALSQFNRLEQIITHKKYNAELYSKYLDKSKYVLPKVPDGYRHSWQSYHILVKNSKREKLIEFLRAENIYLNNGAQCIPSMDYYVKKYNLDSKKLFPNAYKSYVDGLVLPLSEDYREDITYKIIEILNNF